MTKQILFNVILREEKEGGYSVLCPELEIASQGETFEESLSNIKEAIELYFESAEEIGIIDEVLDKIGLNKKDLEKGEFIPKIITANIPISLSI